MSTRRLAAALALLAACSWPPLAASPLPQGEVFRIDASGDCQEQSPDAAPLPGGGFVTVWAGGFDPADPAVTQIYARVTGADGAPAGPEIRVSETGRLLTSPAVAVGADGRFLVTWTDLSAGVRSRLFTAAGAPVAGETSASGQGFVEGSDVAARPAGGYAILFVADAAAFVALVDADGHTTEEGIVDSSFSPTGFDPTLTGPEIAVQPDGDLVVGWTLQSLFSFGFSGPVVKLIAPADIGLQGHNRWVTLELDYTPEHWQTSVTLGLDARGGIVIAWVEHQGDRPGTPPVSLKAQTFGPQGEKEGAAFRVDGGTWSRVGAPRVLVGAGGDFVLAWHGVAAPAAGTAPSSIYARSFTAAGVAAGDPVVLAPAAGHSREEPALARFAGAGGGGNGGAGAQTVVAVWQEGRAGSPVAPQGCFSAGIAARRFSPGCVPDAGRLCLGGGRFQLSSVWTAPGNVGQGQGQGQAVTHDTGYFWFFGPENVELMVKVLDGRAVNGKFWVFYGSLSNVAWTLRVADLQTGAEKVYSNPAGQLASRGDTAALPGAATAAGAVTPAAAPLSPVPSALLLSSERFAVEVTFHDPFNNVAGSGVGTRLTDDSGYFTFFSPSNVELVVKILDGRAVNGKFWVFYGALTNVEYDIKVTQLLTGIEKTYHNPPFQFRSVADTSAFN